MNALLQVVEPTVAKYVEQISATLSLNAEKKAEYYSFDFQLGQPKCPKAAGETSSSCAPPRFTWTLQEPKNPDISPADYFQPSEEDQIPTAPSAASAKRIFGSLDTGKSGGNSPQTQKGVKLRYKQSLLFRLKGDMLGRRQPRRQEGQAPPFEMIRSDRHIGLNTENIVHG